MLGCVFLFAGTPKELTGEEWVQMVQDEKADFVKFAIQLYKDQGVAVNKPAGFYVYALDTTISSDTEYESESVYNLLDELLEVERLHAGRDMLGADHGALDHEDVETGLERDLVVLGRQFPADESAA